MVMYTCTIPIILSKNLGGAQAGGISQPPPSPLYETLMYHITVCVFSPYPIQPLFNFVKFHPGLVMDSNSSETHGDK